MANETEIKQLESILSYLIKPNMTIDEKIKALSAPSWRSHNLGYGAVMAGKMMGGINDAQTEQFELDCKYKYEINRLIDLLEEIKGES